MIDSYFCAAIGINYDKVTVNLTNTIFNKYLDEEIHEFEQFANELSQKLGISPDTITKALN